MSDLKTSIQALTPGELYSYLTDNQKSYIFRETNIECAMEDIEQFFDDFEPDRTVTSEAKAHNMSIPQYLREVAQLYINYADNSIDESSYDDMQDAIANV